MFPRVSHERDNFSFWRSYELRLRGRKLFGGKIKRRKIEGIPVKRKSCESLHWGKLSGAKCQSGFLIYDIFISHRILHQLYPTKFRWKFETQRKFMTTRCHIFPTYINTKLLLTATIFVTKIRKSPNIGEIDCKTDYRKQKIDFSGPGFTSIAVAVHAVRSRRLHHRRRHFGFSWIHKKKKHSTIH